MRYFWTSFPIWGLWIKSMVGLRTTYRTAPRLLSFKGWLLLRKPSLLECLKVLFSVHFTYLDLVSDDRLSWNEQIKQLISKAGKRIGMLGRLRRSLTRESANILYCSLIRPILEYCVNVWGCCGEGHKHGLEVIQNRAARIVARTVRSNPAMDVLNRPTLEERRRKTVLNSLRIPARSMSPTF